MARKPYSEPSNYFPEDILKEVGLGQYNEDVNQEEQDQREKDNQELRDVINNEK